MIKSRNLFFAIAAFAAVFASATAKDLAAGDCGWNCYSCGDERYEGRNYNGTGFNMNCSAGPVETCDGCGGSVDDFSFSIAEMAAVATVADVPALVAGYGERLRLNADRNMLVVVGSTCDPDQGIGDLVVLPPEVAKALATELSRFEVSMESVGLIAT